MDRQRQGTCSVAKSAWAENGAPDSRRHTEQLRSHSPSAERQRETFVARLLVCCSSAARPLLVCCSSARLLVCSSAIDTAETQRKAGKRGETGQVVLLERSAEKSQVLHTLTGSS